MLKRFNERWMNSLATFFCFSHSIILGEIYPQLTPQQNCWQQTTRMFEHTRTSYSDLFAKSVDNKNILMISNQNVFNFSIIIWVNIIFKNTCIYNCICNIHTQIFFYLGKTSVSSCSSLQEHLLQKKHTSCVVASRKGTVLPASKCHASGNRGLLFCVSHTVDGWKSRTWWGW